MQDSTGLRECPTRSHEGKCRKRFRTTGDFRHKKRPLGSHPQRSGVLFPVTSSECSRCSAVRSGRTVRGGSDDRSWFGRPQAIKKGGRECRQQQGDERVEGAGLASSTTLFRQSSVPWASFTNCQKKEGSHPLSVRRICPFTEEASEGLREVHLLVVAVTTKRLLGSATQEKAEVPPSALFDAFISYG